jgi:hypothetical protein
LNFAVQAFKSLREKRKKKEWLEPSWWAIFQPWPHPPTPAKMVQKLPPEPFF